MALESVTFYDYPQTAATVHEPLTFESAGDLFVEGRVFAVRRHGQVVAVTAAYLHGGLVETRFTSVHPDHRRQGLATLVKAGSVLAFAEQGHTWFGTGGAASNTASRAMNEAVGYEITETWHTLIPPSRTTPPMARAAGPGGMSAAPGPAIEYRPLLPNDVFAWAELINHLLVEDSRGTSIRAQDLAYEFQREGFNPATDSCAAWKEGRLVGWVNAFVPHELDHQGWARGVLHGGVHAHERRTGVGTALMDTMEAHAQELLAERHPDVERVRLVADAGLLSSSARTMLLGRGYHDHRFVNLMERDTAPRAEQVQTPEGLILRSPTVSDLESLRTAHGRAFAGQDTVSQNAWHEDWTAEWARLDESTIVLDRAGHPVAYVLATQWADRQLHLNWIGTVPEHRGRGLALLALSSAIHKAHLSRAYDLITLTVDSANPTGAQRLYERAGFSRAQQTVVMSKVVTDDSLAEQIAPAS